MNSWITAITDRVATKRGMWVTLAVWLVVMIGLSAGPRPGDYKTTNFQTLPDDAPSIVADRLIETHFPDNQGTPGILVFHHETKPIDPADASKIINGIREANIDGIDSIVDIDRLPPVALKAFTSEDQSTMIVPMMLAPGLGSAEYGEINDEASRVGNEIAAGLDGVQFYITGPAGIAGDTVKLFEEADFVLLAATIVIILVLLIVIYRSPLLALIPLLATLFVYQVVNQIVGIMGASGLELNNATTSIMSILLFAAVVDYSLFVFSRYREELGQYESKYDAMKSAMRSVGVPVFFAGGTVLAAMLILFFAEFNDYSNFAPVFGAAMLVIMIASITLVPALFTLFGRKSFWPKVPKVGDEKAQKHGIWGPIARFVVNKPAVSGGVVAVLLVLAALNAFNLKFEFDMVKSFPEDLPSRVGYEIVESRFDKGELAPTTALVVADEPVSDDASAKLLEMLSAMDEVAAARLSARSEDSKALSLSVALSLNPYSPEALDAIEHLREKSGELLDTAGIRGDLHLAGVTAKLADERTVNNRDIVVIVALETLLILALLFALTRKWKMPLYMMATILLSYAAALGLGIFLVDVLFGYDAISTRVPVYSFIFLVALGIDYNIIVVSRFLEERRKRKVKDALEVAISHTGGVISSAGVILAATFAALTTMPIADLFVFGFMVAIGILMDTFLIRGMLLPSLILFFEKDGKQAAAQPATEH